MNNQASTGSALHKGVLAAVLLLVAMAIEVQGLQAQTIAPAHASNLTISNIGGAFFNTAANASRVTQMTFGPGPDAAKTYLYLSSHVHGVRRAEYNSATGSFVGGLTSVSTVKGNGIAFHGNTMYLTDTYQSSADANISLSRLWRASDANNDGIYETSVPIVEGIPRNDHSANQIQIRGNSLFVGLGVRTRNGVNQTFNGETFGESAYGGSVGIIEDVTQVANSANSAGFFPANPTAAQHKDLVDGTNPVGGSPYTSTAVNKLRAHSTGLRNPYGVRLDGDGELWVTNNFQRAENHVFTRNSSEGDAFGGDGFADDIHDQLFKASPKADYGYRNANWQTDPVATNAGFFLDANRQKSFTFDNYDDPAVPSDVDNTDPAFNVLHNPAAPVGLGPHSSSNGLDFYDGNAFQLQYHKDAFVARWNQSETDGGQTIEFRDVVSVDIDTGKTNRIASGFVSPLDVVADPNGNLIVADYGGSLHLIRASSAIAAPHTFNWSSNVNGNWSDRLTWNAGSQPADDRMVPHAWGTARYAVVFDQPGANPTVTLDQDARVESVRVADRLRLTVGNDLTVDQVLTIDQFGVLIGNGLIVGNVSSAGSIIPGDSAGSIAINGNLVQQSTASLQLELFGLTPVSQYDQLVVAGNANLAGALNVIIGNSFDLVPGMTFEVIDIAGTSTGIFTNLLEGSVVTTDPKSGVPLTISYVGGDGNDVVLTAVAVPEPSTLAMTALAACCLLYYRRFNKQ